MIIYVAVMVLLALFNIITYDDKKSQRVLYNVALVVLFCMTAFRWEVGCDFPQYQWYGIAAAGKTFDDALTQREPGYWIAAILITKLGMGWQYIDVLAALSFYAGLHAIARREPNPLLFLTLAYPALAISLGMSGVRQSLGAGFVWLAFNAFADRKRVTFIAWILIGALFHRSAVAFLAFAPFLFFRNFKISLLFGAVAAVPMVYLMSRSEAADSYANMYIGASTEAAGARFRVIPTALGGVFFFLVRNAWKEKYSFDYERMLYFMPLLIAMIPLVLVSSVMGDRFCFYLMPLAFSAFTRARYLMNSRYSVVAFFVPLGFSVFFFFAWITLSQLFWNCYVPYKTWWV